jgi:hypothetical protein
MQLRRGLTPTLSLARRRQLGLMTCCAATACPSASMGTKHGVFVRSNDTGRSKNNSRGNANLRSSVALWHNSPQAKGRIERLWGTFQDCPTRELRLVGATRPGHRQCGPPSLPARLQSPPRPCSSRNGKGLACGPQRSQPHLLLCPRAHRQQRKRSAMGRPPFPNPAPIKTLQLRRCQGSVVPITSRNHRDLLRRRQA